MVATGRIDAANDRTLLTALPTWMPYTIFVHEHNKTEPVPHCVALLYYRRTQNPYDRYMPGFESILC